MNKNVVIFILVVLIFIGGIWGSLNDRKRIALEKKVKTTLEKMEKMTVQSSKQREHVLGKTAGLQETLAEKEEHLTKARKELVTLRKEVKTIEAQLSGCNADIQKLTQEKAALENKLQPAQAAAEATEKNSKEQKTAEDVSPPGEATTDKQPTPDGVAAAADKAEVQSLQEKLHTAELTIDRLRQRLNGANAQMMGLEKLLEEKNAAMEETSQDMDRLQINMDVLLSKIADQRDQLQEIQEENRDLVKELAAKNEEVADLQEEIMRQPVQE